jgi:hypothetical protein
MMPAISAIIFIFRFRLAYFRLLCWLSLAVFTGADAFSLMRAAPRARLLALLAY